MELSARQRQTLLVVLALFVMGWTVRACRISPEKPQENASQPTASLDTGLLFPTTTTEWTYEKFRI